MGRGGNLVELMWLQKITIFHRSFEIGNKEPLSSSCSGVCPPHSACSKGLLILCYTLVTPLSEQAQLIRFPSQLSTLQCAFFYQASHSGSRSGALHRFLLPSLPMGSCFIVSLAPCTHAVMVSLISLIPLSLEDNVAVQSGNWICLWEQGRSHRCWRENDKAEKKRDSCMCQSSQAKLDLACNHARCNTFSDKSIHHGMWSNKHMHVINTCAPADKH